MRFEPLIRARINKFKNSYGYSSLNDDDAYELFINYSILERHQPDSLSNNPDLLDFASVGGSNDMGIDGLAVLVNNVLVSSILQLENIIELQKNIDVEFLFIQSKNKDKLDSGDYGKFTDGVVDFLGEDHFEPHNDKIEEFLNIKNRIFQDDVLIKLNFSPSIRIYYAFFGEWRSVPHFDAKTEKLKQDINLLNAYSGINVVIIDNTELKKICEENERSFSASITFIDSFGLTEVENVKNSQIVLCNANEIIKVMTTEDGLIRKSLFTDNVRDYQGDTEINNEILDTLKKSPSNFSLLNNGITIVCTSILPSNRKVTLSNPQIVNGCQTCHVLFEANKDGIDLSNVTIIAKIIGTDFDDLTNSIVKGTNNQNVVSSEAFETTRDFHKNLEDFFAIIQKDSSVENRVFYERRSRQYYHEPSIMPSQTINVETLARSFTSVFLDAPHNSTTHIIMLLKKYKHIIFVDGQSFYPYFIASLMCINFERLVYNEKLDRLMLNYKYHILLLASEKIAGISPEINDTKKIDAYCEKLLKVITNTDDYANILKDCSEEFNQIKNEWIEKYGFKYRHAIKDNVNFTEFLITFIRGGNADNCRFKAEENLQYRGIVVKAKKDRNDLYYGFIQKYPDDIFFHQSFNPDLDFENIYGKTVIYNIFDDSYNGEKKAKIIKVL